MSLDKSELKEAIKNMVTLGYTDVNGAVSAWVSAYNDYANGSSSFAQDESTDRVTGVNSGGLASGFYSAFTSFNASSAASYMQSGAVSYWTAGVFAIAVPPTIKDPLAISDVSSIVNNTGSGLASELLSIFSVVGTNIDEKAEQIATAFDNHIKTVTTLCNYIKTNVSPPPPFLPAVTTLTVS